MLSHLSCEKTAEYIRRNYWFPKINGKVKLYISNCLKCIAFNEHSGKNEGVLYSIPKGNKPFDTIHIDYFGPLEPRNKLKYILVVIDGFSKFIKIYATKSQTTEETIKCLDDYISHYSRPNKLISDRGTCFTSGLFQEYCRDKNIQHILVASGCPKSNGQVERVNRTIRPMIAKCINKDMKVYWPNVLSKIEFAVFNNISKTTKYTPSQLVFGICQKGQ